MEADAYRRESREGWNRSAAGWLAGAERMSRATMPVSEWLVDALAPQPGHHVLELATGTGEVGLLVAELVRPGGEVILSDFSPGMLDAAQQRAAARGLDNVRFKQIDAESIDIEAASQDGVVCRWGLMLMADPEAALRESRRVLRAGRPVVFAAWAAAELNPWRTALDEAFGAPAPPPGAPGMFAWAQRDTIAGHLAAAGFTEYEIEPLDFTLDYADVDDWLDDTRTLSSRVRDAMDALDAAATEGFRTRVEEAVAPHRRPDGGLALPARSWVGWACA